VLPYIYGLGGREIYPDTIERAFAELEQAVNDKKGAAVGRRYLNLREE
jgi:pyruvate/2-oxoacid:ferredoxin oxidoreductase alpha subunit